LKNCALDRKVINTVLMVSTSSITKQSLGKIVEHAPAGAKIWCLPLCYFFCLSRSKAEGLFVKGRHSSNNYCVTIYGSILMRFSTFFQKGSAFQMQYTIPIFVARRRHKLWELAVQNCENSKNQRKSLCAPLRI